MPYDDCQSFFNVFTQISPAEETFGWKILVANQPMPVVVNEYDQTTKDNAYILGVQWGTRV